MKENQGLQEVVNPALYFLLLEWMFIFNVQENCPHCKSIAIELSRMPAKKRQLAELPEVRAIVTVAQTVRKQSGNVLHRVQHAIESFYVQISPPLIAEMMGF